MKKLLLSLMALIAIIPCAIIISANNSTAPAINSPMQPSPDMNNGADMTCPTEEEMLSMLQQEMPADQWATFKEEYDAFKKLTPEEQEVRLQAAMEDMVSQLPPEEQEELGLLALEELGKEMLSTPEGQAFAEGVQAGAELKEFEIAQEVEAAAQQMAPMLEEIAKSCPIAPATPTITPALK